MKQKSSCQKCEEATEEYGAQSACDEHMEEVRAEHLMSATGCRKEPNPDAFDVEGDR